MKEKIMKLNSVPFLWVSGICLLASFVIEYILPMLEITIVLVINPAWFSLVISGLPLAYLAVESIRKRKITSPILITIAMIAAVYIGDIFAAGEIAFIMAIGEFLEDKTVDKARKGVEMLLKLVPTVGRVVGKDGEKMVEARDIAVGDIIRVLPGECFPSDGKIILGSTTVDQSIITGESLPIDKFIGDEVFTGTINRFGAVDVEVTNAFSDSLLEKMIRLVEESDNKKAPTQKIVDKWAGYLVPAACILAIAVYIIFAFALGRSGDALIRAVTILVVFCPCALALATPISIMAAIGQATNKGVLIKSGEALEEMGAVSTVCFDKTGTITQGKLAISDIITFDFDKGQLLEKISSVECKSEHPIGKAVVAYARENSIAIKDSTDFEMHVGKGVKAEIDSQNIYCGNEKLIVQHANVGISKEAEDCVESLRMQGKAVIIAATNDKIIGVIGLSDEIKSSAKDSISALKTAGIENVALLTGDNERSAQFIGGKVGFTKIYANQLPQDKSSVINSLMQNGEKVCMVGDGVNDAPALKIASVGIAMGTMGSDIAIDSADIAIMGDDISKISYIKKLSNATIFSIKFNITLSMIINISAIVLSIMGVLTPATGALVHNAGSVFVVLNASRLYNKKIV